MSNQNFVTKLGFNRKGYDQIVPSQKPSLVLTGESLDLVEKIQAIKKKLPNLEIISIGSARNSISKINVLIQESSNQEFENIIAFGGGSIIDIAKRFFLNLNKLNKNLKLIVIPTLIGSGAESSMTSIINTKNKKIIISDYNQLPHSVIYDTEILKSIDAKEIIFGTIDALTHCFESTTSFLTNPYLHFLSNQTIDYFFKNINYEKLIEGHIDENDVSKFCIISFNGGLAQNNAGAGLCHALSHAAESMTFFKHNRCINYFLEGTLEFIEKNNEGFIKANGLLHINELKKIARLSKENIENKNVLDELIKNDTSAVELMLRAKQDPCWRLFNLKGIKDNILKTF
ncbi:iron-containing alcohol dehydrogenase [Gammaproteobacteria bacterium]|nr:iron-containing alcohol dehydrogenase [Gammaproteobacteria bacterium]